MDSSGTIQGAASASDCVSCPKDRTTKNVAMNEKGITPCLCKKEMYYETGSNPTPCISCPKGSSCTSHHGIKLNETKVLPGFWRVNMNQDIFLDCRDGYLGATGDMYAKERCCPVDMNCTNSSGDSQCALGYSGTLCRNCAANYVVISDACVKCEGGPIFTAALLMVICIAFIVFLLFVIILCRMKSRSANAEMTRSQKLLGQCKIILGFVQILASMPMTMSNVK